MSHVNVYTRGLPYASCILVWYLFGNLVKGPMPSSYESGSLFYVLLYHCNMIQNTR